MNKEKKVIDLQKQIQRKKNEHSKIHSFSLCINKHKCIRNGY